MSGKKEIITMITFKELENAVKNYNKTISKRFEYHKDEKVLYIGTNNNPFNFREDDFEDAYKFIEEYGMLKSDNDCLGKELYYKGLKWNELTDKQRESIIEDNKKYVVGKGVKMDEPDKFESLFNDDRSFLVFW